MYRVFEMLPGILSWTTLISLIFLSWYAPLFVTVFIITFDIYWLLKTIFFSFHLRHTFSKMKENLKIDWLAKLNILEQATVVAGQVSYKNIFHLVILPMSREPYEVLKETFLTLENSNYSKEKLIIILGVEERCGREAILVAKRIENEFSSKFYKFLITVHPANIPNELPGKGSNEAWAAREARRLIIDKDHISYENILVSVFDADTQLKENYFSCLTYNFITTENPLHSSYQPIPLFLNNIHTAGAFARVISFSATFWHMMQQSRPERLTTFSSHSMPFRALIDIGFWETNVVSEDSRIFWQCFFHYNGNWKVVPLYYPVSMDANVAKTFWKTLVNQYKQQRRWGYGVENIPYIFYNFLKNKIISSRTKFYWSFNVLEGFHSWATNAIIIFILGWLPLLIGRGEFHFTLLSYNLPQITRLIMLFASFGIISSAFLSLVLMPPRPNFKKVNILWYLLQWILMPITLIIFGSFPAFDSQTRLMLGGRFKLGFWITPKHR